MSKETFKPVSSDCFDKYSRAGILPFIRSRGSWKIVGMLELGEEREGYQLAKGSVKKKESPLEAALREGREELNCQKLKLTGYDKGLSLSTSRKKQIY